MSLTETTLSTRWPAAVIMERRALDNRWATEKWEATGVVPDLEPGAAPKVIVENPQLLQLLFSGFDIVLQRDEAEGYYMNITSTQPKVFVMWRLENERAQPHRLTVSYHEGSRWLDSGESVDAVPLPAELLPWMAKYCEENYKPEPQKKRKYASNKDKGRMGNWRPD